MMLILIPCKNLDHGKSRLAPYLDPPARRTLCESFLRQTLALATSVVPSGEVKIVTRDSQAVAIGNDYGVASVPDLGTDLNSALSEARRLLLSDESRAHDALVLPIDLPYATKAAIEVVIAVTTDCAIVPDRNEEGTNLLFLRFPAFERFPFLYGGHSFVRHCEAAQYAGRSIQIMRDHRLSYDIDEFRHYAQWKMDMDRRFVQKDIPPSV